MTETLTSREQRGYWSGRRVDDILSENHAALPERKGPAEQDDWREVRLSSHVLASLTP
jgi:hypothetical protein